MSSIAPVYLFTGPEKGEKNRAVSDILDRYTSTTGLTPEIYKFYAFEASISEVIALLKNGGLFSEYKFVFLMNIEDMKKSDIPLLLSYLHAPGKEATLFLLSEAYKVDSKITKAVKKENTRTFWELFENQKINWLQSYFRKNNKKITPDAIEMILEMVENRTDDMERVCSRLLIIFKDKMVISDEEIEEFVFHSKEENVFTLFDHMTRNDFSGSIEILHKIRLSGNHNPVQLLSGLLWQYRNLLNVKLLLKEMPQQKVFAQLKINGKRKQTHYLNVSKLHSVLEIEDIINCIAYYDRKAREITRERWILLMELFIYYSVIKKGKRPELYKN